MKILAIGDFHGEFPSKFNKIIDKEKIDLVISLGDYPPFHYRKLWFKYCYGKDVGLWEIIGKKRYKQLVMKDLSLAENSLKKLNKLKIPVFTVLGNIDYPNPNDVGDYPKALTDKQPNWEKEDLFTKRLIKYKNIHRFDYRALKFQNYILIGMRGHSAPGKIKSKAFRKHKTLLERLFKKFGKENREGKIIFASHNVPYDTKLDIIGVKPLKTALKAYYGRTIKKKKLKRHYGSKMARKIINKYHPILALGGHIHESFGEDKIGRTTLINPGAAHEGKAAVVELDKGKIRKIKFIK